MTSSNLDPDPKALERYMKAFALLLESRDGRPFNSFAGSPYLAGREEYKVRLYYEARAIMGFGAWRRSDVGSGRILRDFFAGFDRHDNLVDWRTANYAHADLRQDVRKSEQVLFDVYRSDDVGSAFDAFVGLAGKSYDVAAFCLYLRNGERFLPIRPTFFDKSFELLGIGHRTQRRCSWDNYSAYLGALARVLDGIRSYLDPDARLIDAHSFTWMLDEVDAFARDEEIVLRDVAWAAPSRKDVSVCTRARVGQGEFRTMLLERWGSKCPVTGCAEPRLLVSSHIKPWASCDADGEWMNPSNGILLAAGVDKAFDRGLISFADDGTLLLSPELSPSDAERAGIPLSAVIPVPDADMRRFLAYHRAHVFLAG